MKLTLKGMAVWLHLLFLIAVALAADNSKLKFVIETFNIKSWTKDVFEFLNYSVLQLNNRSYINGHIMFQRYYNVIEFESTLDLFRPHKEKMRLFRFKMDGCSYAKVTHKNLIQSLISRTFLKHTKGELGCPILPVSLNEQELMDHNLLFFHSSTIITRLKIGICGKRTFQVIYLKVFMSF